MATYQGSQIRETLKEANYSLFATLDEDTVIVRDNENMVLEVYAKNNDYSGHVLEINGIGYEFVRTVLTTDLELCSPIN